jgi:hypothetical protein
MSILLEEVMLTDSVPFDKLQNRAAHCSTTSETRSQAIGIDLIQYGFFCGRSRQVS